MEADGITDPAAPRRRRGPIVVAVLVAVAVVAGSVAFLLLREGGGTALQLQFAPDTALRYEFLAHDRGAGEAADSGYETTTTAKLDLAVGSVGADGTATVAATVADVRVAPQKLEPSDRGSLEPQTVRIAADGLQLDTILVIADENGQFMSLADPFLPFLPVGGVSAGDSWDVDAQQDLSVGTGGATFAGTATLTRLDGDVATVEADLTETWDLEADSAQVSALGGGSVGETTNTVAWRGTEDLHMTSRLDSARGVVLSTTLTGDYDLVITSAGGDGNDASIHNTGTFRQDTRLVTS